jgi:SAM-dependent methyltransferase
MTTPRAAWKGGDYDRISAPHADMGSPALDRLELDGGERVLDVGCGSGRLTERLMERLPRGSAIAAAMIAAVRAEGVETAAVFHMAGAEETKQRLQSYGFVDIEAWLQPQTISFESRDCMVDYIVTPYLRPATGLPEDELDRVARNGADRLGVLAIDYVRLNVMARKS